MDEKSNKGGKKNSFGTNKIKIPKLIEFTKSINQKEIYGWKILQFNEKRCQFKNLNLYFKKTKK
jgi:hypothetical protein